MAKEKTIPIDVAAKTPLYVEIDADTTSVKFSFAEEGKATSYMYKVDGKKMTSQTDSKLSTVKKMKITNESTNSILSRIEGNTVFNVEKHHGYILWVRLFYEGNSESPCAEAVLVLAPAKLAILNVAACDDRDKTIGGAPFAYRANKRISFQFEYSRPLLKGEKPSILYKIYANKPGEKELCETPIIDSHKDIADLLCVDEGLPESHAGANLAISFGLNDPYEPPFEGKYKTVKFINLTSSEVHKPQITWIVWSSKESAEFGGKSPVRDKICSNEDAFLHIHTRGMYGQKVRVEIYEKDDTFTKALFLKSFNNLLILDNVACVPIAMDEIFSKAKQERWFEGSDYEIIAKVIPHDTSVAAAESKILKLDTTQKEAASPTKSTVNGTQKFTIGSASGKDAAAKSACPRCREEAKKMLPRLKEIFPKVAESKLSVVAETYTKYMRQLGMDSCWNKAHFFAQVAIETGHKLDLKDGESFNYYWEALCGTFGAFKTDEGKKKAKEWGRSEKKAKAVSTENQKKIANYAYSPSCNTGKQLGNTLATDGWNFRGRGLIQLTGRAGYAYAHTYTKIEGVDILSNPDLVGTDLKIGVLAAMAFWKWKGLQITSNATKGITSKISIQVGKKVDIKAIDGSPSTNYIEKNKEFKKKTSVSFQIDSCKYEVQESTDKEEGLITYHIYAETGEIVKEIPKKNNDPQTYEYIYHDKEGNIHTICQRKWIEVPEMETGDILQSVPDGYNSGKTYIYPADPKIDAEKAYYYYNEKNELDFIVVKPKPTSKEKIRKYHANNAVKKKIIKIAETKNVFSYVREGVFIEYTFKQTARFYCGADQFAAFIGALAEIGVPYIGTGNTSKDATGYPSVSHVNGYSFDFSYNPKKDQKLLNALVKFGFPKALVGLSYKYQNAKPDAGHKSHIHCGPYKKIKIKNKHYD